MNAAVLVWALAAAGGDDQIIIIDDDKKKSGTSGKSDDDGVIIIQDQNEAPHATPPQVTGALGRLWETWHVAADADLLGSVQLVEPQDGPWRMLGSVWLESRLLPAPNLAIYATGFGRAALDSTAPQATFVPFLDLNEAYAKVTVEKAAVTLGRIVVPWGRTQAAALGDRVNPPDLRRGPPFPDAIKQKEPEWGATVKTSVGSVGLEGVYFAQYANPEGSLAASNQGGVRIARYQSALVRSPARVGGLLGQDDTTALDDNPALVATSTIAGRIWRRVGDFDVSSSVVIGYDDTPHLHFRPDVARALASEALASRAGTVGAGDPAILACSSVSLACLGGPGTLAHDRTTSFSLDASWGLGVVIVRAEGLAHPNFGILGGKDATVVDDAGLRTETTSQYAAALAVEGSLGDAVDGSLEAFDVVWDGVPATAILWGVEPLATLPQLHGTKTRQVHRVAGAASLGGSFVGDRVHWRVRGEAGVLQPDVLMSAELRYQLPVFGLYVGGRTDLFTGVPGSPGWFRQDASLLGVFVGEGGT